MVINARAIRQLVAEERPGTRISAEYMRVLDSTVRAIVLAHLHRNGGKRTMKSDVTLGVPASQKGPRC